MPSTHETFIEEYSHKAFIKDIYLELPEYKYHHSPLDGDDEENFIGRKHNEDRFVNILSDSEDNGAYLITGYRGMGKTSFVKKVLKRYKKSQTEKGNRVGEINISFAQFDLKERDILKQITRSLIDEAEKNVFITINKYSSLVSVFRFIFFLVFIFFVSIKWENGFSEFFEIKAGDLPSMLSIVVFLALSAISLTYVIFFIKKSIFLFSDLYKNYEDRKEIKRENGGKHISFGNTLLRIIVLLFSYFILLSILLNHALKINEMGSTRYIFLIFINPLLITVFAHIYQNIRFFNEAVSREKDLYDRLILLYDRCNATLTNESGTQSASNQLPFGFISKNVKAYPIASPKEIEFELIAILKEYNSFKKYKRKFVFVFDELDKVEPTIGKSYYYDDTKALEQYDLSLSQLNELRERKRVIVNILASLKYFITEAKARFIFIAGREMFDAALADIADRQSSISSIFSQIIYIDSFLKDQLSGGSLGLTDLIEAYLNNILLRNEKTHFENIIEEAEKKWPGFNEINKKKIEELEGFLRTNKDKDEEKDYENAFLIRYSAMLDLLVLVKRIKPEERYKILFTLQDFIIYLTYRSNGAPKKLTKILEDYIVKKGVIRDSKKTAVDFTKKNVDSKEEKIYLKVSFKAQYKFNFITYLYRPFLIAYSNFIKKYSDYVLVSTPYLMDHLMKFHPFAFSVQNLELIPEVLSANRNPILRFFIEEIIFFLSQNHIRETEITLFDYKFYNKTSNEIIYLSKIFEEESAAFNFTLDETYFIKLYIRNKIKELRTNHKDFKNPKDPTFIYSISFLNGLLGDAYYFDQEFDDSIISYLDALQYLRDESSMSLEKFTMLIQLKLKLGLVYEKMKSYETAISYYNDIIYNSQDFLIKYEKGELRKTTKDKLITLENLYLGDNKVDGLKGKIKIADKFKKEDGEMKFNDMISIDDLLQIINQAYIASLYIHEKLSVNGVTFEKLSNYQEVFKKIVTLSAKQEGFNFLIMSNYHSNVATMLYFKNLVPLKKRGSLDNDIILKTSKIKTLVSNNFDKYKENNLAKKNNSLNEKVYEDKNKEINKFQINEPILFLSAKNKYENGNKDYRFSFYSFLTYKQALEFLLSAKQKNWSLIKLCQKGVEIINGVEPDNFENRYNKSTLINIALLFSRIGDVLFTTYEPNHKKVVNTGDKVDRDESYKRVLKANADDILTDISISWREKTELDDKIASLEIKVDTEIARLKTNGHSPLNIDTVVGKELENEYKEIEKSWYTQRSIKPLKSDPDIKNRLVELKKMKGNYARMSFFDQWLENFVMQISAENNDDYLKGLNDLNIIIFLYYLSGRFYSKAGKSVSHSFQLRKIIQIISNCVKIEPKDNPHQNSLLKLIQEAILPMILEVASWNSNSTDRPQIYKYKFLIRLDETNVIYHPRHLSKHIYSNISNNPETKEAVLLFAQLKVKSIDFSKYKNLLESLNKCEEQSLVNQNGSISTQFSRILELDLQNNINRALLKTYLSPKLDKLIVDPRCKNEVGSNEGIIAYWESTLYGAFKKYNPTNPSDRYSKYDKDLSSKITTIGKIIEAFSNQTFIEVDIEKIFFTKRVYLTKKILFTKRIYSTKKVFPTKETFSTKSTLLIEKTLDIKKIIDEYAALITSSIFCLRQIISIIKIYDVNYYLSYSYLAHFHRELGVWLQHYKFCQEIYREYAKKNKVDFNDINILDKNLKEQLGKEAMTVLDATSQFQIALQLYHKAKEIHSNGAAYQSAINNFIYLEDDFNDNLYHFGIALERQMLNSYVIRKRIKELEDDLKDSPLYNYNSYANNDKA